MLLAVSVLDLTQTGFNVMFDHHTSPECLLHWQGLCVESIAMKTINVLQALLHTIKGDIQAFTDEGWWIQKHLQKAPSCELMMKGKVQHLTHQVESWSSMTSFTWQRTIVNHVHDTHSTSSKRNIPQENHPTPECLLHPSSEPPSVHAILYDNLNAYTILQCCPPHSRFRYMSGRACVSPLTQPLIIYVRFSSCGSLDMRSSKTPPLPRVWSSAPSRCNKCF